MDKMTIQNGIWVERFDKGAKETLSNIRVIINGLIVFTCVGLELPWANNQHGISCILAGKYPARKTTPTTNLPYEHIAIDKVEGRDGICVHIVNFVRQLRGCVGVGAMHKDIDGDDLKDVTSSKPTFDKIMALVPESFEVLITEI